MSSRTRSVVVSPFAGTDDFNAQLYAALRGSPWWMISIATHALLFVLASFFSTEAVAAPKGPLAVVVNPGVQDELPEPEAIEDEIDTPVVDQLEAREPFVVDNATDEKPSSDNDLDHDDTFGNVDGAVGAGDLDGISNNSIIGPGGGWRAPGSGLGSRANRGRPGSGTRAPKETETALEDALRWLAAHQSPDGSWEAAGFSRWCDGKRVEGGPDGAGKAQNDVGVSGLALLAFLGAGYTHRSDGPFGDVVKRGLRWMINTQDAEGCFGPRASTHFVYGHAIASLAVVEAYGMTGGAMLRNPAQKALDFVAAMRNPYVAWRYGVKPGDNDTSVTGWMVMVLKSARLAVDADVAAGRPPSLQIDADALDGARAWVEKMTDPDSGRVGYQLRGSGPARPTEMVDRFPAEKSESMTAAGVLSRIFLGEDPKTSAAIKAGAKLCTALPPRWADDGSVDMYYWYYGTLAMFQVGGETWKSWEAAMKRAIVDSQRRDGDWCGYRGSWDPIDPWGADGGRVYATAVMATCLEVYYRYGRVVGIGK